MVQPRRRYDHVPPDESRLREGIRLFNAGRYFESHEVWESLWHDVTGRDREFLQGLIQLAAAYHHVNRKNLSGARYLSHRARVHLEPWVPRHAHVPLGLLLKQIDRDVARLTRGTPLMRPPKIPFKQR